MGRIENGGVEGQGGALFLLEGDGELAHIRLA